MTDIQYLQSILEGIVSSPKDISINRSIDDMGVLLTIKLAKKDMGRVIGRDGRTINAIRLLVGCFGFNINSHLNVKVDEPVV